MIRMRKIRAYSIEVNKTIKEMKKMGLCKSHITQLNKVATKLAYKLTMQDSTMVVGEKNKRKIERAEQKIYDVIKILRKVE